MNRPPASSLTNGARLVLASVAITYALPAAAYVFLEPEVHFRCPSDRPEVWGHFAIAICCIAFASMAAGRRTLPANLPAPGPRGVPNALMILAIASIAVSAPALLSGASARYGASSLAEQLSSGDGGSAIASTVLQVVAPLLAWWVFLRRQDLWLSADPAPRVTRWTLAVATVACINGLSSAARAMFSVAMLVWPRLGERLLYAGRHRVGRPGLVLAAAGAAAAALTLAAIGLRAKTGSIGTGDTWGRYGDPAYLVGRNSVHFQHALAALEVGIDEGDRTGEFLDRATIAWNDAAYRVGVLAGNPAWGQRPEPSSLSRYTFERFALFEPSERMARGGSSPSIIAAFALCLPPPWSFAAMAGFAWVLVRWLDWLLAGTPRLSWLGCAIIAFGPLRIITDTPTNLPNPFGIPFIVVALATVARLLSSYPPIAQPPTAHDRPT